MIGRLLDGHTQISHPHYQYFFSLQENEKKANISFPLEFD